MVKVDIEKEILKTLYESGNSSRKIAKILKCSQWTVLRNMREHNILRRETSSYRIHTFNYNYFDIIDTEDKAYFMGFLWADGFCDKNTGNVTITLQEEDGYILEEFKKHIGYTGQIRWKDRISKNRKPTYQLQLMSKYLSNTLDSHGMVKAKSLILEFPVCIPDNLMNHFVRGYFDGDGSAFFSGKESGISFCGTFSVLSNIKQKINETYNIEKGCLCERTKDKSPVKQLLFSGSNLVSLVRDYLYKDATIYLHRKYNILQRVIIKRRRILKHMEV